MIRLIATKEIREMLLSPKFVVIFAVSTVLVLLSTYTGVASYVDEVREYRLSDRIVREEMARGSWSGLIRPGSSLIRPPSPLSPVVRGVQSITGRRANIGADFPRTRDSRAADSPVLAVFGELDLAFVVGSVLSLFAILLAFDVVSGEKERGTLKLLLTGKASRAQLLAGKLIGGYATLVVPLAVPLLIASLYLALHPSLGWSGDQWIRFALIVGMSLLYLALFYAIGVLVSSLTHKPAVSFLILLLIWVASVAIAPRTAVLLASQITPVPSVDQMLMEQEAVTRELGRQRSQRVTDAVNRRFREQNYAQRIAQGEDTQAEVMADVNSIRARVNDEVDREIELSHAEIQDDFRRRQASMTATARKMSRLSPASAYGFAVQSLAGTGLESQTRFVDSVVGYREGYLGWVREQAAENPEQAEGGTEVAIRMSPNGLEFTQQEQEYELDLSGLPAYRMAAGRIGDDLNHAIPDLSVLLLTMAGTLVAGYMAFVRYDPR